MISALPELDTHARLSCGTSGSAIYEMVTRALATRGITGEVIVDVGCGGGRLRDYVGQRFSRYIGIDGVLYDALPGEIEFPCHDLDSGEMLLRVGSGDVVVAVETIEHLENARAFFVSYYTSPSRAAG